VSGNASPLGTGTFYPETLIMLEAGVEHEMIAAALHLIVSKCKHS